MTPQPITHMSNKVRAGRTIVVGLGRTGLSCARYLHSRGVEFAVTDSRAAPPESPTLQQLSPAVEVRFGGFDSSLLDGAAQVIASPGVSLDEPFLKATAARGVPIVGDIELFVREAQAPIAAITGTNGKSTVTTLVALMSNAAGKRAIAAGNLGHPVLDLLEEPVPHLYVLELSSFQLDTTHSLRAAVATVLNVTPDHMDRYPSLDAYATSKARIFDGSQAAVLNLDDSSVRAMALHVASKIGFSLVRDPEASYYAETRNGDTVLTCRGEKLVAMSELKIAGLHNAANALASLAMCEALGLARAPCLRALREFGGLPHRSQFVAELHGVRYVDDSKGTNVGATLAAVAGMPGSLVLIAGGQGKGQDFAPLAAAFRDKVRHVVLIGQDSKLIDTALAGVCTTEFARDMDDAVQAAANAARQGETVLLSPACASLDMFRDYAHRGDVFAAAVRRLSA
jgi:UDP-N-acetylmuramoylalanine--D-glutamate ligase